MSIRKVVPIPKVPIPVIDMKGIEAEYFSSTGPYAFYITMGGNLSLLGMVERKNLGEAWGFIHCFGFTRPGQTSAPSPELSDVSMTFVTSDRFHFKSDTPRGAITKAMEGVKRGVFVADTMREVALHWADQLRGTL